MNHKQRQLAAIRRESADRISVDALALDNIAEIADHLGMDEPEVLPALGFDGRVIPLNLLPYSGPKAEVESDIEVTEWGTLRSGEYGTTQFRPLAGVTSVADVEKHHWPEAKYYAYDAAADLCRQYAEYATRGPSWMPIFCRVCDLFGIEEALMNMMTEPKVFQATLERVFNVVYETCRRLLEACGDSLDIFYLGDDFATQRGMMMDPGLWRQYFKPLYAKLFDLGRQHGKIIWFHACGNISAVLPDMIDIGMEVWETVQLHTLPMSPEKLKQEYGRDLTFFGAINTQRLPFMSLSEIDAEVRRCIDILGQGGGYICGGDHHINLDVPPENAVALYRAALSHGRKDGVGV